MTIFNYRPVEKILTMLTHAYACMDLWLSTNGVTEYTCSVSAICMHVLLREMYFHTITCRTFPSVLWHCWLGDRKGIRPVKKLDVGLLVVMIWLELCTTYSSSSPVVTTTSIILWFNKHRLTQVHLERERERERERENMPHVMGASWRGWCWKCNNSDSAGKEITRIVSKMLCDSLTQFDTTIFICIFSYSEGKCK